MVTVLCLVASLFLGGCASSEQSFRQSSRDESELLKKRLAEIDYQFELGRVKKAIQLAEEALVDHYYSRNLRDRLAKLRSIRQVMFDRDFKDAGKNLEAGNPRTAIAILKDIEGYGDKEMVRDARLKMDEVGRAYPAVFKN